MNSVCGTTVRQVTRDDVAFYSFTFFFFKQKTAYEMRISDWSSDVCSSDLAEVQALEAMLRGGGASAGRAPTQSGIDDAYRVLGVPASASDAEEIGRASCRERGCQYV